ncbi:hypothetical protein BZG01_03290 [Labilibaculum manganireducens]|uniref:Capsule polysaccharide biosynthesis protein n=1 Tax=Labilibaculum manganireducens TaxID=1940525 RepID=A0A2N3IEN7_9BACT|nr:hypothetical protein [Labilibaculum manganireducens]PKQ68755.1 hypothetical protein BZG01_03290 [Labilibaculum manganireducens]
MKSFITNKIIDILPLSMRKIAYFLKVSISNNNMRNSYYDYSKYFKDNLSKFKNNKEGEKICFIIGPWGGTSTPWFTITLSFLMLFKKKCNISFIYVDIPFPKYDYAYFIDQYFISKLLKLINKNFNVITLSDVHEFEGEIDHLDQFVKNNMTHYTKAKCFIEENDILYAEIEKHLETVQRRAIKLFETIDIDKLITPGGVWAYSSIFVIESKKHQIPFFTFDSTYGCITFTRNGIASQQQDIEEAFDLLMSNDESEIDSIYNRAKKEFFLRQRGEDIFNYQLVKKTGKSYDFEVVFILNIDWDSSAVGLHNKFENTIDWITETVQYILGHSTYKIAIRQHPAERCDSDKSNYSLKTILDEKFGENPRFKFISAYDKVNTYDLMDKCKIVLAYTSTMAIEAAAMGKSVIIAGNCYYQNLGFLHHSETKDEYFQKIEEALNDKLNNFEFQERNAWVTYYLTQICNRAWTDFTPLFVDFEKWVVKDFMVLSEEVEVSKLLESLDENKPYAYVMHEHFQSEKCK